VHQESLDTIVAIVGQSDFRESVVLLEFIKELPTSLPAGSFEVSLRLANGYGPGVEENS
jgi:hypothetical protein